MPTVELTDAVWARKMNRVLIVGAPNTFKTTSLGTWPRPLFYYGFPGEEGVGAAPTGEGVVRKTYERGDGELASQVWKEVEATTVDALTSKKYQTFAGDGLYQLSELALDVVSIGAFTRGEKVDPFLYPLATQKVVGFLKKVLDSTIPYAVFTCWEGKEVVDAMANAKSDSPRALYPHLPGALAKQVMGLFSVVVYCETSQTPGGTKGTWRLRPTATIRAAGCKLPVELAKKLPVEPIPQDWKVLDKLLRGETA